MPNRRVNFANAFETTLTTQISGSDSSMVLASTTGLTVPCYLVIDPDLPAKREYVYVSALSGNSATLEERHLAGSAAGSGLSHDAGATVIQSAIAQEMNDIHDRLEAATWDHGSQLAGLGDDDHLQYYNEARLGAWLGLRTTSDLAEGSRLYWTDTRFDTRFDTRLATKTIDDLAGFPVTNLVYETSAAEVTAPGSSGDPLLIGTISATIPSNWNSYDLICTVQGSVADLNAGGSIRYEVYFDYESALPARKLWNQHTGYNSFSYTARLSGVSAVGSGKLVKGWVDQIDGWAEQLNVKSPIMVAHFIRTS